MSSIGLNVSSDGRHDPSAIRGLGATWIRIVAKPEYDLRDYFQQCRDAGIQILLVFARESGGDYARYRDLYASLIAAVQVGNEADLVSPSSWTMSQVELAALGRSVRAIFPDTPLVCAGMASGIPSWLDGMDLSWCDAVAVHPYLKDAPNPSDLEDLPDADVLVREYQRFGKPVIVSEWGWWGSEEGRAAEEVRDMIGWAAKTDDCEVFFYFCTDDAMVPPFGLLGPRGREKARARAFKEQAALAVHSLWPGVPAEPEPEPQPEPVPVPPLQLPRGLDVASYQGYPDWQAVARDGYQFAITKLTEGTNYVNPTFGHNWSGIKAAGMLRGVYHFARPSVNTPDAEAQYFLSALAQHAGVLEPGDLVALDIEDERYFGGGPYGNAANWSLGWLEYVEAVLGFKPLVYTGPWYVNRPGWGTPPPELGEYGLWLAAYQQTMPRPVPPWEAVAIWQFTSKGQVSGIVGDCDVNVFNGPIDRLALYGKPGGVVEPPEPPPPAPSRAAVLVAEIETRLAELKELVA